MGRRISDSDPSGKQPCAFCRTMRIVLIFAVMLVMLMAYADKLSWLRDIDFTTLFGYSMVVFFFTVLGYRVERSIKGTKTPASFFAGPDPDVPGLRSKSDDAPPGRANARRISA